MSIRKIDLTFLMDEDKTFRIVFSKLLSKVVLCGNLCYLQTYISSYAVEIISLPIFQ